MQIEKALFVTDAEKKDKSKLRVNCKLKCFYKPNTIANFSDFHL